MTSRRYFVSGMVQGVWYRKNVQSMAREQGFSGYVRNLPDGRVEAVVSCADDSGFARFEALLRKGSPKSRVESIVFDDFHTVCSGLFEVR